MLKSSLNVCVCIYIYIYIYDFCSVITEILPLSEGFTIFPNVHSEFFLNQIVLFFFIMLIISVSLLISSSLIFNRSTFASSCVCVCV